MTKPETIFEDDTLLILAKPSGWITNSAATTKGQPVVQEWIGTNFKFEISNSEIFRSGVVHRLDKETSGLLIIAKTKQAFANLQMQFKEREVSKNYVALVHGVIDPGEGVVNAPVGRLPWRRDRFGVLPGGRSAETKYAVEDYYQDNKAAKYCLVNLKPKTGRTHQIRIHLKHIGHPVVADEFYAGRKTARSDRKWCPRLFLHAAGIRFTHPDTKKLVKYQSDLPKDLVGALAKLKK